MEISLFIDAPAQYFCNWIEDFTRSAWSKEFPTDRGYISLQKAWSEQRGGIWRVHIGGVYVLPKGERHFAYPLEEVISFKVIPLAPNRSEIVARYSSPAIQEYFLSLMLAIVRRWPQTQDIMSQLKALQRSLEGRLDEVREKQEIGVEKIEEIHRVLQEEQVTQGDMMRLLDAIRRYLRYLQRRGSELSDESRGQLASAKRALDSHASIEQKLEMVLPLIPFLLTYKVAVGTENAVEIEEIREQLKGVIASLLGRND